MEDGARLSRRVEERNVVQPRTSRNCALPNQGGCAFHIPEVVRSATEKGQLVSRHVFPENMAGSSAKACRNGCGTIARQDKTKWGVGYVEYFLKLVRTGPRPSDVKGEWTIVPPPCISA